MSQEPTTKKTKQITASFSLFFEYDPADYPDAEDLQLDIDSIQHEMLMFLKKMEGYKHYSLKLKYITER